MTDRQIENRIRKLQEIESQIKALEEQAEAVRSELKADMEEKGSEEITTVHGLIVRWKEVVSSRFDSGAFKKAHEDLYTAFMKRTASRRFTYTA